MSQAGIERSLIFKSLEDAVEKVEEWRRDYNENRLHSSLGNIPRTNPISLWKLGQFWSLKLTKKTRKNVKLIQEMDQRWR
ncbi:MAG: transposase [Planctomycetes bacterium]|nr:transposase [Planctomycetota bacterium]